MKLLPSLKEKKRYVVGEIIANKKFSLPDVEQAVDTTINDFIGQLGKAKMGPLLIRERWNTKTQRFIIKVNNTYVDELKSSLALIKKIKKTPAIIRSVLTTSTINKAQEALR